MKKLIITDLEWICGSDLAFRTSDEKRECMGYDSNDLHWRSHVHHHHMQYHKGRQVNGP
jgi:hypothetical protein